MLSTNDKYELYKCLYNEILKKGSMSSIEVRKKAGLNHLNSVLDNLDSLGLYCWEDGKSRNIMVRPFQLLKEEWGIA